MEFIFLRHLYLGETNDCEQSWMKKVTVVENKWKKDVKSPMILAINLNFNLYEKPYPLQIESLYFKTREQLFRWLLV